MIKKTIAAGALAVATAGGAAWYAPDLTRNVFLFWFRPNLPLPWMSAEVGTGQPPGSCVYNSGSQTWTVKGSGIVYDMEDQFHYCYQTVVGDYQISARASGVNGAYQVGVMVRPDVTDETAANAFCFTNDNNDVIFQWRPTAGAATDSVGVGSPVTPAYVRLVTDGATVGCYYSTNGSSWTALGTFQAVDIDSIFKIGLAVNSNDTGILSTGTITEVVVEPVPPVDDFGGFRPHIQGAGATTPAGRGGLICRITSLSSGGGTWDDGTARGCLEARPPGCASRTGSQEACARTVISDVSGAIDFGSSSLIIDGPYLSFWASTAPSCNEGTGTDDCGDGAGGLTFQRVNLRIDTHDTYINHLRIRRSPVFVSPLLSCEFNPSDYDCSPVHDNIFDHMSVSWADMTAGPDSGVNNVNGAQPSNSNQIMIDSLLAEPLWEPAIGGINVAFCGTFARNLLIHGYDRNPIWSGGECGIYNNVIFNGSADLAGQALISATNEYDPARLGRIQTVMRDNMFIEGPTPDGTIDWILGLYIESNSFSYGGGAEVYLYNNTGGGVTGATGNGQWTAVQTKAYGGGTNQATGGTSSNVRVNTELSWFTNYAFAIIANAANAVRDAVLANAGARPLDRDSADTRLVADVTTNDGQNKINWSYINTNYGGQPVVVQRTRVCSLPADYNDPGSRTLTGGGHNTKLEDWLERDPDCGAQRLESPTTP